MGLFGFGKKKETSCGCGDTCVEPAEEVAEAKVYNEHAVEMAQCDCGNMCKVSDIEEKKAAEQIAKEAEASVKVLGSGCKKCNELEESARQALQQLGIDLEVQHISDYAQIAAYGVMNTPALVVNEKVLSMGKVLKPDEIVALLK